MIYIRSLSFYFFYVASGFLVGFIGCLVCPFLSIANRIKLLSAWPRFSNWILYKACKIEMVVEGEENIPKAPFVSYLQPPRPMGNFFLSVLFLSYDYSSKKRVVIYSFVGLGSRFT